MRGGLRWGLETGEIAHLLPRCLSLAFARPFNRSPIAAQITARWDELGLAKGTQMHTKDIWAKADAGIHDGSYVTDVASRGVVYLLLTPA